MTAITLPTLPEQWLAAFNPPPYLLFTGKGGVGKTSLSSAVALYLADQGRKTLLVSTDPASNLDQVFGLRLSDQPTAIPGAPDLWALNINPRQAAAAYRERVVGAYRGVLPDGVVSGMEEQLSGACTVEIAAFDAFARLLTDPALTAEYQHIIFDTAPTGHTLRLLQLPAAWQGYLDSAGGEASCLGPLSGLGSHREQFAATVDTLADAAQTRLVLVARPEAHALAEAARSHDELVKLGLRNQLLAINGLLAASQSSDPSAEAMIAEQDAVLAAMPTALQALDAIAIPLRARAPLGLDGLRALLSAEQSGDVPDEGARPAAAAQPDLAQLVASLGSKPGVIMTMGKGGVGKTTTATAIARALAEGGAQVHLTTSDPAAHLDVTLSESVANLRVSRIDPVAELERYREEVLAEASQDPQERHLLEENLRSPCTEEIAVFRAFARVVDEARDQVVVIDTAPTGHTILLLDSTAAYHREISKARHAVPEAVRQLLPRLRDPAFTRVVIVTLAEATPIQEGLDLAADLRRAGIEPHGWVVNRSLLPLTLKHPVLRARQAAEDQQLEQLRQAGSCFVLVPWQQQI